jgi:hypothetical protein
VLAGTARLATRAIETIASSVIWPSRIALPLLTFAQSSGPGREPACHSGGFPVHGGRATPVAERSEIPAVEGIWMGLDDEELAFEKWRAPLSER